jgi:hypothetical protein
VGIDGESGAEVRPGDGSEVKLLAVRDAVEARSDLSEHTGPYPPALCLRLPDVKLCQPVEVILGDRSEPGILVEAEADDQMKRESGGQSPQPVELAFGEDPLPTGQVDQRAEAVSRKAGECPLGKVHRVVVLTA